MCVTCALPSAAPLVYDEDEEDPDEGITMKPVKETGSIKDPSEIEPLKDRKPTKAVKFANGRKVFSMPSESGKEGENSEAQLSDFPGSPAHDLSKALQDRFRHKQKKGYIDVWWLFDDGGKKGRV